MTDRLLARPWTWSVVIGLALVVVQVALLWESAPTGAVSPPAAEVAVAPLYAVFLVLVVRALIALLGLLRRRSRPADPA